ncbi:MAG: hypothetical protein CMB56_003840 [Methanobacteriota archaeon]|nr:MAG: hypothetical protein CMB56_003840 [Euryarchaeota archaeon]|tara:strand:- start:249 stop:878 length:630 start_codon:yes stop_codon:yes gene_type:complete
MRTNWIVSMGWQEQLLEWFEIFGPASLAILSFTESIIQPVPPDLMFLPMLMNNSGNIPMILWLWVVITLSSVTGSLVGYWIGKNWGKSIIKKFNGEKHIKKLEALTDKYGTLGIFIAAVSPIPYKVFGWFAGMGEMDKRSFVYAGLFGRGLRFGMEAILIGIYGQVALETINNILDQEFLIGITIIITGIIIYFVLKWWNSINIETETS